jgi:hypothetical protein
MKRAPTPERITNSAITIFALLGTAPSWAAAIAANGKEMRTPGQNGAPRGIPNRACRRAPRFPPHRNNATINNQVVMESTSVLPRAV